MTPGHPSWRPPGRQPKQSTWMRVLGIRAIADRQRAAHKRRLSAHRRKHLDQRGRRRETYLNTNSEIDDTAVLRTLASVYCCRWCMNTQRHRKCLFSLEGSPPICRLEHMTPVASGE